MTPHQRYEELWRELQLCDELGFDYGFCVEHHFRPDESWMSSPSLYAIGAGAIAASPPADWSVKRRIEYVQWARKVAEGLRGVSPKLEQQFDEAARAAERSFTPAL